MADPILTLVGAAAPDPFDPAALRLDETFAETVSEKRMLTTVPVRKPGKQDWVRVHPQAEYRGDFPLVDLKEDREKYIVAKQLVPELMGEIVCVTLFTSITARGDVFLWPVTLPHGGRDNDYWRSARDAAERAMHKWVRIKANLPLGAYDIFEAFATLADPEWPEMKFGDLMKIAFRDRLIDSIDHPVIKQLLGRG